MTSEIKLIVGLGNPGPEYAKTRHNAGAWYVEQLARWHNVSLREEPKFFGHTARIQVEGQDVRLLIPNTYMNLSGKAVAALARFYQIEPEAMLVAHDELDLPPGIAKFKQGGGHGGHNGLKDIIAKMGNNNNFFRLRLGIGHPGSKELVAGFVLTKAPGSEQNLIDAALDESLRATDILFKQDMTKAMNRLHSFKAEKVWTGGDRWRAGWMSMYATDILFKQDMTKAMNRLHSFKAEKIWTGCDRWRAGWMSMYATDILFKQDMTKAMSRLHSFKAEKVWTGCDRWRAGWMSMYATDILFKQDMTKAMNRLHSFKAERCRSIWPCTGIVPVHEQRPEQTWHGPPAGAPQQHPSSKVTIHGF